MKKIIILFVVIALSSCKEQIKDYVSIQGKITNSSDEALTILGENFQKSITINSDGTFQDTLKVIEGGFHGLTIGSIKSFIYVKNGYDLELNFDKKKFPNSVNFNGNGSGTNNYLFEKVKYINNGKLSDPKWFTGLKKAEFDEKIASISKDLDALLVGAKDLDPEVLKSEQENNIKFIEFFNTGYKRESEMSNVIKKGTPSPKFNYPNTEGENISLDDLKGKYVYVDVWATWCGPCIREIPSLKELNKEYSGKALAIVSLSIDDVANKDKWLKMVADKDLQGIQIMADKAWDSDFIKAYNITGIPRFILIDKEGNILDANAPRPSNPRLKEVLNGLSL
ncbi:MAG: TlpA family protein disulfide reductase [Flavobacteriaceae bacterium]|nr:TlpA family protein disulfide reductase [Flavobacteriaceae bacterium]